MIAQKHYWQVTDDDVAKAAQNPAQQVHVEPRKGSQAEPTANEETPVFLGNATECNSVHPYRVGDTGLEPVTPSLSS